MFARAFTTAPETCLQSRIVQLKQYVYHIHEVTTQNQTQKDKKRHSPVLALSILRS
jgi:hypothetical protein